MARAKGGLAVVAARRRDVAAALWREVRRGGGVPPLGVAPALIRTAQFLHAAFAAYTAEPSSPGPPVVAGSTLPPSDQAPPLHSAGPARQTPWTASAPVRPRIPARPHQRRTRSRAPACRIATGRAAGGQAQARRPWPSAARRPCTSVRARACAPLVERPWLASQSPCAGPRPVPPALPMPTMPPVPPLMQPAPQVPTPPVPWLPITGLPMPALPPPPLPPATPMPPPALAAPQPATPAPSLGAAPVPSRAFAMRACAAALGTRRGRCGPPRRPPMARAGAEIWIRSRPDEPPPHIWPVHEDPLPHSQGGAAPRARSVVGGARPSRRDAERRHCDLVARLWRSCQTGSRLAACIRGHARQWPRRLLVLLAVGPIRAVPQDDGGTHLHSCALDFGLYLPATLCGVPLRAPWRSNAGITALTSPSPPSSLRSRSSWPARRCACSLRSGRATRVPPRHHRRPCETPHDVTMGRVGGPIPFPLAARMVGRRRGGRPCRPRRLSVRRLVRVAPARRPPQRLLRGRPAARPRPQPCRLPYVARRRQVRRWAPAVPALAPP